MTMFSYSGMNVITIHQKVGDNIIILPGVNEIDTPIFDKLQSHPIIKQMLEDEKLIILGDSKVDSSGKKPINEMLGYIPKIYDGKLLRKIIKEDGREIIVNAAKNQLELIVNPPSKDSLKAENEHFR